MTVDIYLCQPTAGGIVPLLYSGRWEDGLSPCKVCYLSIPCVDDQVYQRFRRLRNRSADMTAGTLMGLTEPHAVIKQLLAFAFTHPNGIWRLP